MNNKVVTFGEIMMRLAPEGFLRFSQANKFDVTYGGGESNVAVSLSNMGMKSEFVTRLPDNDLGRTAMMEMRKHGVGVDNIVYGGDRLGIYFLETGAVSRGSKVIYDRAHSSIAEVELGMIDWEHVFKDAQWFHWTGITPAISQNAADVTLEAVRAASDLGLTISTDFNYRAKLWNYGMEPAEVMVELLEYCDVMLLSKEDIAHHLGIKPLGVDTSIPGYEWSPESFSSIFGQVMNKFPKAKYIMSALRGSVSASHNTWSGVLYDGSKLHQSRKYEITDIVDRVGGGDAIMAGLIYGLLNFPSDHQKVIDFAVAASCLKHTIKGDANLVSVAEVEKLLGGDGSGRVDR
jgi:2-dehydro-3-deoxygluconokinase